MLRASISPRWAMISAIASRSRPARFLTRATSSESESRALQERISVCMMSLYHAVFRARETAVDARGGAETLPESCCLRQTEQHRSGGPQRAFWRASGAAGRTAPENLSSAFFVVFLRATVLDREVRSSPAMVRARGRGKAEGRRPRPPG